ncbi:MAG TPA: hypothetical protein VKH81_05925 [Candidatus Angelobacter sp.]|nr:hypothetical protein [Candidatus Angelobacter sp.]
MAESFGAPNTPLNGTVSLAFTITNPAANTVSLTGVGFSDTLPAGLAISTPNGLTNSCGGTATAPAATGALTLSGGTIAAGSNCTLSVSLTGNNAGSFTNTSTAVTSTNAGTGNTASASLIVVAPPSLGESFGAANIPVNGTTSLSFTVTNPAANTVAEAGVAFADTLPAGLIISTPNGLTNSCGGTVAAVQGASAVNLSGGSVAVGGNCLVSVNVTGTAPGLLTNTTGAASSTNGGTGTSAAASLTVGTPPTISESFAVASIPLNGTTSLNYTVSNTSVSAIALSGVGFSDSLPTGLVVATPSALTTTCTGTAAAATGSSAVSLSGGTLAAGASCTLSLNLTGTTAGAKNNSVTVGSTNGGTGNTASASLAVAAPPTISEAFSAASMPLNGSASLSFTIANPSANTVGLTGVGVSDALPAGLIIATPNGLAGTCGGGTITATQATSLISLSGASLAANASCIFSLNVTGTAAGASINTTGNVTSTEGGTGSSASAAIAVAAPPSIVEAFGAASIALNGTTTLTFTITNPAANTVSESGMALLDTLPSGLAVAPAPGLTNSCAGTATATAGSTIISLSGGSLAVGASCGVTLNVTGTSGGTFTNTTGAVSSLTGGTGNTASANLTVTAPLTLSVSPSSATVTLSKTQTYTASGTGAPVTWSVNGVVNGNATVGTITGGGVYTAPAGFPGLGLNSFTITATSQANSAVSAAANAIVVFPNDTSTPQTPPIKLGTSGSNANNTSPAACCVGTLGALMNRSGTLFVLSAQHVLSNGGTGTVGDAINQPGPAACFASPNVAANFSAGFVRPLSGTTGEATDNVDAGLAQVAAGEVDSSGSILDLGIAGASSIAAAAPSSTTAVESVGLAVAKSGRTTGLTCSTVSSILTTVTVDYDSTCGGPVGFTSTFVNQIIINNTGGGFAAPGDSGALIVTTDQARPVGLLFAGTSTTAVANPIRDVISAFTIQGKPAQIPGIVGGADHGVSCVPTATVPSGNPNGAFSTIVPRLRSIIAGLSAAEQQRVDNVRLANELLLVRDPMISSVVVAASEDSPGEGALEIHVNGATQAPIPAVIGGVRTRVIFDAPGLAPSVTQQDIDQASAVKEDNVGTLLGQPGIQGIGVAISKDNPGETAIAIYVVRGETHPPIPATMSGVRTQVIEGERFRAF